MQSRSYWIFPMHGLISLSLDRSIDERPLISLISEFRGKAAGQPPRSRAAASEVPSMVTTKMAERTGAKRGPKPKGGRCMHPGCTMPARTVCCVCGGCQRTHCECTDGTTLPEPTSPSCSRQRARSGRRAAATAAQRASAVVQQDAVALRAMTYVPMGAEIRTSLGGADECVLLRESTVEHYGKRGISYQ